MPYKNFTKTEIIDELGAELRKARNSKGLTLTQVAGALEKRGTHVSSIMLGRIETGQRRIDTALPRHFFKKAAKKSTSQHCPRTGTRSRSAPAWE